MLRSYVVIALRNLRRHKGYSFINLIGLSVGIACFLLMALYIQYEYSFDRFHEKGEHIYRVTSYRGFGEKQWGGTTAGDPVPAMLDSYSEVENATRYRHCGTDKILYDSIWHRDITMRCGESSLFDIFSINFIQGDPTTALNAPNTVVLSQSLANKIFGDENPIGKTLDIKVSFVHEEQPVLITGIIEDIPSNSQLTTDLIISFESLRNSRLCLDCGGTSVYTRLSENADIASVNARLTDLIHNTLGKKRVEEVALEPLFDIHFSTSYASKQTDIKYIYMLLLITLAILLIACANYINLATAKGINRTREIGIRKVVGAHRKQITLQLLTETIIFALFALPIAWSMLVLFIPTFNNLAETQITLSWTNVWMYLSFLVFITGLVGLVAGTYPALFLSRMSPINNLIPSVFKGGLRKSLVTFQFVASIFLITGTLIVQEQLRFIQNKKLGFDKDQIVLIDVTDPTLQENIQPLKNKFAALSQIKEASGGYSFPGQSRFSGISFIDRDDVMYKQANIDEHFLDLMDLKLIAGRNINPIPAQGETAEVLITPKAIHTLELSSPEEAIEKVIFDSRYRVVGVVNEFHHASLHEGIEPVLLIQNDDKSGRLIGAKLAGGDIPGALKALEAAWQSTGTTLPFEYKFLEDEINLMYEQEQRAANVFGIFAGLAILLSCMGLVGLAMFITAMRTRELGIRKILGASILQLLQLLSMNFLKLVFMALVITIPLVYLAAQRWLASFTYHIDLSPLPFALAGGFALLLTLTTISLQAYRAASLNPVDTLRQE